MRRNCNLDDVQGKNEDDDEDQPSQEGAGGAAELLERAAGLLDGSKPEGSITDLVSAGFPSLAANDPSGGRSNRGLESLDDFSLLSRH